MPKVTHTIVLGRYNTDIYINDALLKRASGGSTKDQDSICIAFRISSEKKYGYQFRAAFPRVSWSQIDSIKELSTQPLRSEKLLSRRDRTEHECCDEISCKDCGGDTGTTSHGNCKYGCTL